MEKSSLALPWFTPGCFRCSQERAEILSSLPNRVVFFAPTGGGGTWNGMRATDPIPRNACWQSEGHLPLLFIRLRSNKCIDYLSRGALSQCASSRFTDCLRNLKASLRVLPYA